MPIPLLDLARQQPVDPSVIQRVLNRARYIAGPELAAFEAAFAAYCGATHCVGVGNGTDALELALRAGGVQPGDEVAAVANAGMYGTTAIRALGAIPVYVDVDPQTLLMSASALESALGPRTRAVIVTHLYGQVADMPAILRVVQPRGVFVIEDCAQAHGARLDGRMAGAWGHAGTFSFYPTKNLGAYGDAGCVISSDPEFAARLRALREYGWTQRFHSTIPGGRNSRMDEIQAAVLHAKLPHLDALNRRRRDIARRYAAALAPCRPLVIDDEASVAHLFVIRCEQRDALRAWLAQHAIASDVHYPVPDPRQLSQANLPRRENDLMHTERACRQVLSLPCFPELRDEEVDSVIECISAWRP
jgi:dTDP-4-amino-4,6-dideoxygalactose transaminase